MVTILTSSFPFPTGFFLIDKAPGPTSFQIVSRLRRTLVQRGAPKRVKVGHGGTLDPFATGLLVLFAGKEYTKKASTLLEARKRYCARLFLGAATTSYDLTGDCTAQSSFLPTLEQIDETIEEHFQGASLQLPPMFSAKKIDGQRLYHLARQGQEVERARVKVEMEITLLGYHYPYLDLEVFCSKGTYIRSLAHDLGVKLGCFAHLVALHRTQVGPFLLPSKKYARLGAELIPVESASPEGGSPFRLHPSFLSLDASLKSFVEAKKASRACSAQVFASEWLDRSIAIEERAELLESAVGRLWPL